MGTMDARSNHASRTASVRNVDMKLEVVVIPVSDLDRAKQFYGSLGWRLDADVTTGDFRLASSDERRSVGHGGRNGRLSGPDPDRSSYRSYASSSDPDGNGWLLQEVTTRLPGRIDPAETAFASVNDLAT